MCRKKKRVKYLVSRLDRNDPPVIVWMTERSMEGLVKWGMIESGYKVDRTPEEKKTVISNLKTAITSLLYLEN